MAKKRNPKMTMNRWLQLTRSPTIQRRIRNDPALEDSLTIFEFARRLKTLDWVEAVALLHVVYAWMPTMLRPISPHSPKGRIRLVEHLRRVKTGEILSDTELGDVENFSNKSIVGASKLLHVLCPKNYPIWDSRVASEFLWTNVAFQTYSNRERFTQYFKTLHNWISHTEVQERCSQIRQLNTSLSTASDIRLVEYVLYRKSEPKAKRSKKQVRKNKRKQ